MNDKRIKNIPSVTICVPVYCVEKYIERCAVCIFEQTYENLSYIFVDDCSTDRSMDILHKVILRYPQKKYRVKIIKHKVNRGLAAARNTAVKAVSTPFLFNLDSDDTIHPRTIELLVRKQLETDADIVTSAVVRQMPNGKLKTTIFSEISSNEKEWCCRLLSREIPVCVWGRLIRTSLYHENQIYAKEGVNMCEDYHVISRLAYFANRMDYENKAEYYYNCQNMYSITSVISESKFNQQLESLDILYDFFQDKDFVFIESYFCGAAKLLAEITMNCCRSGNHDYFNKRIKAKLQETKKQYIGAVPWIYRIAFYLPWFRFLNIYANIGHLIKKCHFL